MRPSQPKDRPMTDPEHSRLAALEAEASDLKRRNAVLLERLAEAEADLAHALHSQHRQSARPAARLMAAGG